ncbi:benzaldehyde dehydrogenase (NAD) [Streptomyces sp. yr375]|uniref:aldehyde dehydrogenase family protein n=1 Tax=Streptomyces sp. yr375 TaxID=1761906 RepID=UPI0008AF3595|nr:aldehyde dehydrogenase family protein [Streptomyces sp. yr375]SES27196.1 benzaldehyde dehydrogenase (NAD) [Streptomyces sp. yr375]
MTATTATSAETWPDAAEWTGKIYSGGWRQAEGGTQPVYEPATGARLAEVGVASPGDVARAGALAARAQRDWAAVSPAERAEVLLRAARELREHSDAIREWIVRESAGVPAKGDYEIAAGLSQLAQAAGMASLPLGEILSPSLPGQSSYAWRVPLGVVGVINPWNAPLLFAMRVLAPALVLGNAVLLKPDPRTPVSGGVVVARLFEDAGLPEGLLHVLPGGPGTGEAVVADPHVAMVSFTGSARAGRAVARAAGDGLKRVALELGGKNSIVVLDDADVAAAAAGAMSTFGYQGQACVAAGRHLVHADLVEPYTEALIGHAQALRLGDPRDDGVDLGPVIDERQAARIERIVDESVAAGARVRAGGRRDGLFYPPTVLDRVARAMPAFGEEIFGPVAPIIAFRTDAEALDIANDTAYGLAAAVHSRSLPRATAFAGQVRTGMVHINDVTAKDAANAPFGGMGASGNGSRIGGTANLEQFTQWRWTTLPGTV